MITITHPDTYQCEVCKTIYERSESAVFCEKQPVTPCPYKVGDIIGCITRYDGIEYDEVVEVRLLRQSTSVVANCKDFAKLQSEIDAGKWSIHYWAVRVANEHQMGKELDTDIIRPYSIEGCPDVDA